MWSVLQRNRDIRRLFIAQLISFIGDWFAYVAFVGLVQDFSDSKLLVTMVLVAQALPAFLVSPLAGTAADRFDRKRILVLVSAGQAVAAAGLLMVRSGGTLWLGYLCLCLISALGAFVGPAAQAGLPNLATSAEELRVASLMFGSLWGTTLAFGAAIGGWVAAAFGRDVAFAVNTVSFVVAAGLVLGIRRAMQEQRDHSERQRIRPIADMADAVRYARKDPVLLSLLGSKATFAVGAGIVGLLAAMATGPLHGGDGATGLLIGARGIGVAAGPLIAARLTGPSLSRILLISGSVGVLFGICYLGLSVATTLWLAALLSLIAHLGGGAQWTLSTYGLQLRAGDEVRGRIMAGDFALATLIISLSNLAAGNLADAAGVRTAIAIFAVLNLLGAVAYLLVTRRQRAMLRAAELAA